MKRALLLLLLAAAALATACKPREVPQAPQASANSAGDPVKGKLLAAQYGCNTCHIVPGVEGPQGSLGPSLEGVGSKPTISEGTVPNQIDKVAAYLVSPATANPNSSMPAIGVTPADARDIAAYMATLK